LTIGVLPWGRPASAIQGWRRAFAAFFGALRWELVRLDAHRFDENERRAGETHTMMDRIQNTDQALNLADPVARSGHVLTPNAAEEMMAGAAKQMGGKIVAAHRPAPGKGHRFEPKNAGPLLGRRLYCALGFTPACSEMV
jgi:hypothetical protein